MPGLFDPDEIGALAARLGDAHAAELGVSADELSRLGEVAISAIQSLGFDKRGVTQRVRGACPGPLADRYVNAIWLPVLTKAEELATASRRGGWEVLAIFSLLLAVSVIPTDSIPAWVHSKWVVFVAALGVIVGVINVVRGTRSLAAISAAVEASSAVALTATPQARLKRIRPRFMVPGLKQVLIAIVFLTTVVAGGLVADATIRAIWRSPAEILDFALFGGVLWFMTVAIGGAMLGFVGILPGAPRFAYNQTGARLVLSCLFWSQLSGLGVLLIARAQMQLSGLSFPHIIVGILLCWIGAKKASQRLAAAKQNMALAADAMLSADRRPTALYLRSFAADAKAGPYQYSASFQRWGVFGVLRPSHWIERRDLSLEEVICRGIARVGPVVAIGEPGEPLPKLGAARKYVDHGDWQTEVARLMAKCRIVCLVVGTSDGLLWEFRHIVAEGDARRVLLLIPPGVEYGKIWEGFVERCSEWQGTVSLPRQLPYDALGVSFTDDWTPIIHVGLPTAGTYHAIAREMLEAL